MGSTQTNLQATKPDGHQLSVQQTATDSPILPAANLLQLQKIDPKLVDWVVAQTEKEANFRRDEIRRTNTLIFVERIGGLVAGAGVSIVGLGLSAFLAMHNHYVVASVIGGTTLVGIVALLVSKRHQDDEAPSDDGPDQKKKKKR